jgi:hypothetical protein
MDSNRFRRFESHPLTRRCGGELRGVVLLQWIYPFFAGISPIAWARYSCLFAIGILRGMAGIR